MNLNKPSIDNLEELHAAVLTIRSVCRVKRNNEQKRLRRRLNLQKFRAKDKIYRIRKMGLTPEQYAIEYNKQAGHCAACNNFFVQLAIDHDHACCPTKDRSCGKCFRGLLCSNCNTALGLLKDNSDNILGLFRYLHDSKHRQNH